MESELEATQASKKTSIIDVEKIKMAAEIPGRAARNFELLS